MNHTKEKALCTVAAVQNAENEPSQAQNENSTKSIASQVLHLFDDLEFVNVDFEEIDIIVQDLVQQIYMEIELVNCPHDEYSRTRIAYYAAMLRMISKSIIDLRKEFTKVVKVAEKLSEEVSK